MIGANFTKCPNSGRWAHLAIVPQVGANPVVQILGKGFGQAVGQGLEQNRAVVVMGGQKLRFLGFDVQAGGDGKQANIVRDALNAHLGHSKKIINAARIGE